MKKKILTDGGMNCNKDKEEEKVIYRTGLFIYPLVRKETFRKNILS